jgi:hypothetical protein
MYECGGVRVLDWWQGLLNFLIQKPWIHFAVHCHTQRNYVHSHVLASRCLVAVSNSWHPSSSRFPSCFRPQNSESDSNISQRLSSWSSQTISLSHQSTTRAQQQTDDSHCYSAEWTELNAVPHLPPFNMSTKTAKEAPFLCCSFYMLFWKLSHLLTSRSLPSNAPLS